MNIGKYKITGLLGSGGMGRVYKARLPEIGKTVAVKLLYPNSHIVQLLGKKVVLDMFMTEARILGEISHPNVAQIFDFDYDDQGRPFFVMEYHCMNLGEMTGEDYVMENPARIIPPDRAARYLRQVLSGLGRLHDAGIIHRDVKPYNMLISESDQIRITDFGLSLLRGEKREIPDQFKIGTPYYAAPEQEADPETVDERADIYGVGVMAWRMLTGHLLPENNAGTLPGKVNPLLGQCWDEMLMCATNPEPSKRFTNCDEMIFALDNALESWKNNLEQTCRMQDLPAGFQHAISKTDVEIRNKPRKVSRAMAGQTFGLDKLWRPVFSGSKNFEARDEDTVSDVSHGLVWQRAGSRWPLQWDKAGKYVEVLNERQFAGITTWRLPTVDELASLLFPVSVLGDFCTPELFAADMARLWSADRKSFTAAWFVDTALGYVGAADFTCPCHVRAVSNEVIL
jgi:serine/threonine-protein kinase